jgi:DNA-binding MurR/RpiR family transcriptional regulator
VILDLITERADLLTTAERRVGEVVAREPEVVAFGTVAEIAERSGTSGPSVMRFAAKLGFAGYSALQAAVRGELADQLRPAAERIRQEQRGDILETAEATEVANVLRTLRAVRRPTFDAVVDLLADPGRQIVVLPGEVTLPLGGLLARMLDQLRDGVFLSEGAEMRVSRDLARLSAGDVVVAVDLRRYERWLVPMVDHAARRGAVVVAVTDSPLAPIARVAEHVLLVAAAGTGPFDSLVGVHALMNALVTAVASRARDDATGRLDAIEATRHATRVLLEPDEG